MKIKIMQICFDSFHKTTHKVKFEATIQINKVSKSINQPITFYPSSKGEIPILLSC